MVTMPKMKMGDQITPKKIDPSCGSLGGNVSAPKHFAQHALFLLSADHQRIFPLIQADVRRHL